MIKVIKAPEELEYNTPTLFLAGTIDNGSAEDWQTAFVKMLDDDADDTSLTIFNPRRADWNSKMKNSINNPYMVEQMAWERKGLKTADLNVFVFIGGSISPVTMMELGMMEGRGEGCAVMVHGGYFRKANVEFFCEQNEIPVFNDLQDLATYIKNYFK